ncbi:MAG TPA: c-type cytochrome [Gammaproteobacteria bacterium]
MDQDRKFLDTFIIVIGALLAFTVAMHYLANSLAETYLDTDHSESPVAQQAIAERLAPIGQVRTTNDPMPEPVAVAATAAAETEQAQSGPADGKAVYEQACIACHGAGIAGAPKFGDAAAWTDRIAKGVETLHKHAIEGFQGETGFMPPKGGRMDLSDAQVEAAVDYMISQSK